MQPEGNPVLRRYMSFTKFVQMLDSSSLYFCRADKFDDPFEGSFTRPTLEARRETFKEATADELSAAFRKLRQWHYVTCWHMSDHESEAMWKLYGQYQEAVAIRTTYQKLARALPQEVYLGLVRYLDYEKDDFDPTDLFSPFMHKRLAFQHEREVRGIIRASSVPNESEPLAFCDDNPCDGRQVQVELSELIDSVAVSPLAPPWFADLVRSLIGKLGHDIRIELSEISGNPLF